MSQNRALAQEIRLGSPPPHKRVGSGDETNHAQRYLLQGACKTSMYIPGECFQRADSNVNTFLSHIPCLRTFKCINRPLVYTLVMWCNMLDQAVHPDGIWWETRLSDTSLHKHLRDQAWELISTYAISNARAPVAQLVRPPEDPVEAWLDLNVHFSSETVWALCYVCELLSHWNNQQQPPVSWERMYVESVCHLCSRLAGCKLLQNQVCKCLGEKWVAS